MLRYQVTRHQARIQARFGPMNPKIMLHTAPRTSWRQAYARRGAAIGFNPSLMTMSTTDRDNRCISGEQKLRICINAIEY